MPFYISEHPCSKRFDTVDHNISYSSNSGKRFDMRVPSGQSANVANGGDDGKKATRN